MTATDHRRLDRAEARSDHVQRRDEHLGGQAAICQHAGQITAAGRSFDVTFQTAAGEGDLADLIDAAYHATYDPNPYVAHLIGVGSRQSTIWVRPSGER